MPTPLSDTDLAERGLLDPLLGLLTAFVPPQYLTKSISIYASFEGHANFPPIASVVSELEGALDHLLPVSALLANIESEVGAILSMVGHVVGQVDLPLPTVSATGVLNVGPSP